MRTSRRLERRDLAAIRTGYSDLDTLLGGLKRSDLVIVGARPSVGKSSFALGIARNAAVMQRANVGFFSLEMSGEQLAIRLLSAESGVDAHRLRLGQQHRARRAAHHRAPPASSRKRTSGSTTRPCSRPPELRAKARRLQGEQGPRPDRGRLPAADAGRVAERSREPRAGDQLHLADAQGPRARARRADHRARPALPRDREPPSAHADALRPAGLRLDRAGRRHRHVPQPRRDVRDARAVAAGRTPCCRRAPTPARSRSVDVAKHRNGPTGGVDLRFRHRYASFEDWGLRTDDGE